MMIRITKNEGNTIFYTCDCGTKGKCMIKPLGRSNILVTKLSCAMCDQAEKIVLIQYENEVEKAEALKHLGDADLSWSLILSNEIVS